MNTKIRNLIAVTLIQERLLCLGLKTEEDRKIMFECFALLNNIDEPVEIETDTEFGAVPSEEISEDNKKESHIL